MKYETLKEPFYLKNFSLALDSSAHSIFLRESIVIENNKKTFSREKSKYDYFETETFKQFLDNYIEYLKINKDYLDFYVNVDAIGNTEESAAKSWEILKYMETFGLNPIPVFHFGEDEKWLKKMIDNYPYIGIGGLGQDTTKRKYIPVADKFFKLICDSKGRPVRKIHGFALTSVDLMIRYPWYSVDSSTWTYASRSGSIIVPKPNIVKGALFDWNYLTTPRQLAVTSRRTDYSDHFENKTSSHRDLLVEYLAMNGITYEQVNTEYYYRDLVNILYMYELEKSIRKEHAKFEKEGAKIYLAGTPSGAGTTLSRIVNLMYDLKGCENIRFLGAIEYRKMLDSLVEIKTNCDAGVNLQTLQKEHTPRNKKVNKEKLIKKENKKLIKFNTKVTYEFSYTKVYDASENLTQEEILEKEFEQLQKSVQQLIEKQKATILLSIED